jgi:hypothetical protein
VPYIKVALQPLTAEIKEEKLAVAEIQKVCYLQRVVRKSESILFLLRAIGFENLR